ncbi:hypothetical protein [Gorillibacterium sp. sgz500922]|uniref:hypothetical protein n=1 Tax=Gorillibacterium sp. sgz500922 TaxID=3446694 RepID=UPI003F678923
MTRLSSLLCVLALAAGTLSLPGCASPKDATAPSPLAAASPAAQVSDHPPKAEQPDSFPLRFQSVQIAAPLTAGEEESGRTVLVSRSIGGVTVELYSTEASADIYYASVREGEAYYRLGPIGYPPFLDGSLYGVESATLAKSPVVKLSGVLGAGAPIVYYVDPAARRVYTLEAGTVELPLPNGDYAVLATMGTPAPLSSLYVFGQDGAAETTDLNAAMGAAAVYYDPNSQAVKADFAEERGTEWTLGRTEIKRVYP